MRFNVTKQSLLSLAVVLLSVLALQYCKQEPGAIGAGGDSVAVQIPALADRAAVQEQIPAEAGHTQSVLAYMQAMQKKGLVEFTSSGEGDMVLIESLQGLKNQGATGKNWLYAVDGKLANRGVATMTVAGGQRVQWCYVTYAERESCGKAEAHP